jgi:hypothetical protein
MKAASPLSAASTSTRRTLASRRASIPSRAIKVPSLPSPRMSSISNMWMPTTGADDWDESEDVPLSELELT